MKWYSAAGEDEIAIYIPLEASLLGDSNAQETCEAYPERTL